MKHTIWTIINTIIFMMNLILTGITAILLVVMRDDMRREARRRIDHRNKINSIYGNRHVTYYEPVHKRYMREEEEE